MIPSRKKVRVYYDTVLENQTHPISDRELQFVLCVVH